MLRDRPSCFRSMPFLQSAAAIAGTVVLFLTGLAAKGRTIRPLHRTDRGLVIVFSGTTGSLSQLILFDLVVFHVIRSFHIEYA